MSTPLPPPLPTPAKRSRKGRWILAAIIALGVAGFVFNVTGHDWYRNFDVPTMAMAPTIEPHDKIIMDGLTYLTAKPKRGDVIIFKTDDIPMAKDKSIYVKRLIGLPGDELSLADGKIVINGKPVPFYTRQGEIHYTVLGIDTYLHAPEEKVVVPANSYFVLGDNSAHSSDSRVWGFVPAHAVIGRAAYCYWPPAHARPIQ